MSHDLWAGRELAWRLAVLWALIIPLANTAVWLFLTGSKVVQVAATPIPYPVFVFTGTLLRLNPLTPLILNARAWFTGQSPELLLLLLVWKVYRLAMPILIERMSA